MRNPGKLFLVLCFLTIGGRIIANAQTASVPKIEANVPFAFVVGDTRLPAGRYLIRTVDGNANDVIEIRSARDATSVVFDTVGGEIQGAEIQRKTKLVFDVVEGQYFLAEIWLAGSSTGNELTESRMEKKLTDGGSLVERQAVIAVLKRTKP
jgi:hypothetical protein